MRPRWPATALLLLGTSCAADAELPPVDLMLRVSTGAGADGVAPGQGFPLVVVRQWTKDLEPEEWSDRALSPLAARLEGTTRREDARRVEETRRYWAHVLGLSDARIRPVKLVARQRGGGSDRVVTSEEVRIRVRPVLDPKAPGPPELPEEPRPRAFPWAPAVLLAGASLLLLALARRRLRREPPPAPPVALPPAPPPELPHVRALGLLAGLRAEVPANEAEVRRGVLDASNVVRGYVSERWGLRAAQSTSEEILAHGALPSREALRRLLASLDVVKFAAHLPTAHERAELFDAADDFVRSTAATSSPGATGSAP